MKDAEKAFETWKAQYLSTHVPETYPTDTTVRAAWLAAWEQSQTQRAAQMTPTVQEGAHCNRLHVPACGRCGKEQTSPGGLVFDSPDADSLSRKTHLCQPCYEALFWKGQRQ